MPFNSAGVYSLPQAAFVTNTTISSTAVNSNFSDIASALTTAYQYTLNINSQMGGNCQLTKSGASTLLLSPYNGNTILIAGVLRAITAGGVSLTLSGLSASTLYYVYATWSGSAVTLAASTTGHTTDTTYGNEVKTGDTSSSLVGMFYATATNDTVDTAARRLVASWFNPPARSILGTAMAAATTTSTSFIELNSNTSRVDVVLFANRSGELNFQGTVVNSSINVYTTTNIGIDSSLTAGSTDTTWNSSSPAVSGPFQVFIPVNTSVFTEGYHYVTPLGKAVTSGTGSWTGAIRGFAT